MTINFFNQSRSGQNLNFQVTDPSGKTITGKITATQTQGGIISYSMSIPSCPQPMAGELAALASDIMERLPSTGTMGQMLTAFRAITDTIKEEAQA